MKIALLTLGTRGDVQPFAVLGKALQLRGHQVTLSTAQNFSSFIQSYNLPFVPVDADFQEILNSPEGKKMMRNPFSARKHLNRLIFPMIMDALKTFYAVSKQNDCVLFHTKALAEYYADGVDATFIKTNVVPAMEPTREFVNPVISSFFLPKSLNRISYKLSEFGLKMMSKPINDFRKQVGLPTKVYKRPMPSIYGISDLFLSTPKDYPVSSHFTGFWLDKSRNALDNVVTEFINHGNPPILFTLGSMPFESKLDFPVALNELTISLGIRLIVIKGWGFNDTSLLENNKDILVLNSAPYELLFPLVKAVIHHGGIGTIAACLKAGKPFLTCPVLYPLGDQYFWGDIAYKKGIGLKPIPLKKMTNEKLIAAVKELISNQKLYQHSAAISKELKFENGVNNAIRLIESYALIK